MNDQIALNVALCLYGKAYQNGEKIADFFDNSATQFCKEIKFLETKKTLFGKVDEKILFENPNVFFEEMNTFQYDLYYKKNANRCKERLSVAFAGGCDLWRLITKKENETFVWKPTWNIGDRDRADSRIWNVSYKKEKNDILRENNEILLNNFYNSLKEIYNFSIKEDLLCFAECFKRAMQTLDSQGNELFGYYKDLVPMCYKEIEYILDACQSAWVFGGMGSWNDLYFKDASVCQEYEMVSENLYNSIISAIVQSVNGVV